MTRVAAAVRQMHPDEHLRLIMKDIVPVAAEIRSIADVWGMILAERVVAAHDLPLWNNSAMDGFAVRATDVHEGSVLEVVGEVLAGSSADPHIPPGSAARIMTGAMLPADADTVVRVEDTSAYGQCDVWQQSPVQIAVTPTIGAHVRRRGEDVAAGGVLAEAGATIEASLHAAMVAAGVSHVSVHRGLRVAVITTGTELRAAGGELQRGQIIDSNSLLVRGMLRAAGITAVTAHHSPDDEVALRGLLQQLAREYDAIITTGGIGPGSHDVVRLALEDEPGVRTAHVTLRPGQHQCAGRLHGGAFLFALPGNPVSAAVSFELFVRPALLAMSGRVRVQRHRISAIVEQGWAAPRHSMQVVPVRVNQSDNELTCAPVVNPRQMSHAVARHGRTDAYALIEVGHGDVATGQRVPVILVTS